MRRFIEYIGYFILIVLLQSLFFDNLNLGIYIHPLIYVAFIILLPLGLPSVAVLAIGLATGVCMDFMAGTGGLHTIAVLFSAFIRNPLAVLVLGKEEAKSGIPVPSRIGTGEFMKYSGILILLHCTIFFLFESPTWSYLHLTLIRIVASSAATWLFVYLLQMLLPENRPGRKTQG